MTVGVIQQSKRQPISDPLGEDIGDIPDPQATLAPTRDHMKVHVHHLLVSLGTIVLQHVV